MQWSDVTAPTPRRILRQFAGIWLVFFVALAGRRWWMGDADVRTWSLAAIGVAVGGLGLAIPAAVRWVYTGAMLLAFPIGWTVTRVMLLGLFYLLFTPVAVIFKLMGRDELRVKSSVRTERATYWKKKAAAARASDYFRQF